MLLRLFTFFYDVLLVSASALDTRTWPPTTWTSCACIRHVAFHHRWCVPRATWLSTTGACRYLQAQGKWTKEGRTLYLSTACVHTHALGFPSPGPPVCACRHVAFHQQSRLKASGPKRSPPSTSAPPVSTHTHVSPRHLDPLCVHADTWPPACSRRRGSGRRRSTPSSSAPLGHTVSATSGVSLHPTSRCVSATSAQPTTHR